MFFSCCCYFSFFTCFCNTILLCRSKTFEKRKSGNVEGKGLQEGNQKHFESKYFCENFTCFLFVCLFCFGFCCCCCCCCLLLLYSRDKSFAILWPIIPTYLPCDCLGCPIDKECLYKKFSSIRLPYLNQEIHKNINSLFPHLTGDPQKTQLHISYTDSSSLLNASLPEGKDDKGHYYF